MNLSDITGFFSNVLTLPETIGAKIGNAALSEREQELARAYGENKTRPVGGDTLDDCKEKLIVGALTGGDKLCSPDNNTVVEAGVGLIKSELIKRTLGTNPAIGIIGSGFSAAIEVGENHRGGIEEMTRQGVPGYSYQERLIDGIRQQVWVDATTAVLSPEDDRPTVYETFTDTAGLEPNEVQDRLSYHETRADVAAYRNQATNAALEGAQGHIAEHGFDSYKSKVDEHVASMYGPSQQDPDTDTLSAAAPAEPETKHSPDATPILKTAYTAPAGP